MKTKNLLFVCVLTMVFTAFAAGQERVSSPLGFSIQQPGKWLIADRGQFDDTVRSLELSPAAIEKLLKSSNNSVSVMAFLKYAPDSKAGVIPTIQVRMRANPIAEFPAFMPAFIKSLDPSRAPFEDLAFVGQPAEVSISGYRAVEVNSKYTLRTKDGKAFGVRSRTYAIPSGKQFFQITFLDDPTDEDCSVEFDSLVRSIKIER